MKAGDQVKIKDGSYMLTVMYNRFSSYGKYDNTESIGLCRDTFTVLATNGRYPAGTTIGGQPRVNSTMIVHNPTGEIWFCSRLNITPALPEYTIEELYGIVGHKFELIK